MTVSAFANVAATRLDRDGRMSVFFLDERVTTASLGREAFATTSAIAASTHLPHSNLLYLTTTRR